MRIHVAADGSVLEVIPDPAMPPQLHPLIRRQVAKWHFSVPMWQGRAVSTWTEYTLWLQAVPTTSGGFALRVVPAGSRMMKDDDPRKAPVYPTSLMRRGIGGAFVYQVQLGDDGTVGEVSRRLPEGDLDRDQRKLDESARTSIRETRWSPVTANGRPVACNLFYPIIFTPYGETTVPGGVESVQPGVADLCPRTHLETEILGSLL